MMEANCLSILIASHVKQTPRHSNQLQAASIFAKGIIGCLPAQLQHSLINSVVTRVQQGTTIHTCNTSCASLVSSCGCTHQFPETDAAKQLKQKAHQPVCDLHFSCWWFSDCAQCGHRNMSVLHGPLPPLDCGQEFRTKYCYHRCECKPSFS